MRSNLTNFLTQYVILIQWLIRNTITAQTFQLSLHFRSRFDNSLNNSILKGSAACCVIYKPAFAEFPNLVNLDPAGDLPDEEYPQSTADMKAASCFLRLQADEFNTCIYFFAELNYLTEGLYFMSWR